VGGDDQIPLGEAQRLNPRRDRCSMSEQGEAIALRAAQQTVAGEQA
jgi:hypothetical protein